MSRTYYVIELTARWLTALVVGLAVLLALAFALGYGAAWSVLGGRMSPPPVPVAAVPTPTVTAVYVAPTSPVTAATRTPPPPAATATATPSAVPRRPTATPRPAATATPRPAATATPTAVMADAGLWVQVLATGRRESAAEARSKLERLGFPADHQQLVESSVAGGNVLLKVRVGPFPDRESAERVVRRMQAEGFPDAWVVTP